MGTTGSVVFPRGLQTEGESPWESLTLYFITISAQCLITWVLNQ